MSTSRYLRQPSIPLSSGKDLEELFNAEYIPEYLAQRVRTSAPPLHIILNNWYSALKLSRDWWKYTVEHQEYKEYYWSIRDELTGKSQPTRGTDRFEPRIIHAYFVTKLKLDIGTPAEQTSFQKLLITRSSAFATLLSTNSIDYEERTDTYWKILGDKKAEKTAIKTVDLWPTTLRYRVRNRFSHKIGPNESVEKLDSVEELLPLLQTLRLYNPEPNNA